MPLQAKVNTKNAQEPYEACQKTCHPVFVGLYRLGADRLRRRFPDLRGAADAARVLRSVLMKPEHEAWAERLVARLDALAGGLAG